MSQVKKTVPFDKWRLPLLGDQFAAWRSWSSLRLTIIGTVGIAVIGSLYIAHLILLPPAEDDTANMGGYFDKRWILALYGLGVVLVYFPAATKRLLDTLNGRAVNARQIAVDGRAPRLFWRRVAAVTSCGFLLAFLDIGPVISDGLVKFWEAHELVHLGSLQKLAQGAVPYVGAKSQYGPGHQLISYLMMRQTEFTLLGFRASFFVLNIIAEGILFSVVLYSLGWGIGLAGIFFSRLFCPIFYLGFLGWFVEFRWMGPLLVGLLLPLVIWSDRSRMSGSTTIAAIGAIGGALAWFSQENFSTILVAGSLIFCASFARDRYSLRAAVSLFGVFALSHILSFLILLSATVGPVNLREALYDAFRAGTLWAKGLANTPWTPWPKPESPWTVAFYLTPFVVIILSALGLWAPIQREQADERMLAKFLGVAAAAASLVPITLLRSDDAHFLGPSIALPFLILLGVTSLPSHLTTCSHRRKLIRASLLISLVAIYIVPQNARESISRLLPDLRGAWDGVVALAQINNPPKESTRTSFFESRLGFSLSDVGNPSRMRAQSGCYFNFPVSCGELADVIDEIRAAVDHRTVFLDIPLDDKTKVSSPIYFFADLNPATSNPEVQGTIWTRSDLDALRGALTRQPPECIISWGGKLAPMLQEIFGSYTTVAVRNGFVYCRNENSARYGLAPLSRSRLR
jgi:hypothetical protein